MTSEYNRDAAIQAAVFRSSVPMVEKALDKLLSSCSGVIEPNNPIVIAELGTAGGKNSNLLLSHTLSHLHKQFASKADCDHEHKDFVVYMNDLPHNDWSSVVKVLESPDSFLHTTGASNVQAFLVPKSFYQQLFPRSSLHLILSMITLHWLSRVPNSPGFPQLMSRSIQWQQAAHDDLVNFLSLRAFELKAGGQLVASMVASSAELENASENSGGGGFSDAPGPSSGEWGAGRLTASTLLDPKPLISMGLISEEEAARMAIPIFTRSREEVLAAVAVKQVQASFELCDLQTVRQVYKFADGFALADFYLSIFLPSILSCLDTTTTTTTTNTTNTNTNTTNNTTNTTNTTSSQSGSLLLSPRKEQQRNGRERAIHQALRSMMALKVRGGHQLRWTIDYHILALSRKQTQ